MHKEKLQLSEDQSFLKKDGNSITISIVLVLMEHLEWKMNINTDIVKPIDPYTDDNQREYLNQCFKNQNKIYDRQLLYLTRNIVKKFVFNDSELAKFLETQMGDEQGMEKLNLICEAISMIKDDPKKFEDCKDLLFGIDIDSVDYSVQIEEINLWTYMLFNMIFLDQRYAIFSSGESIKTSN